MSASGGLNQARDLFQMKTENLVPRKRLESANNRTNDIEGAQPRVWAKTLNRPEFNLANADIEGSGPRMLHIALNKP